MGSALPPAVAKGSRYNVARLQPLGRNRTMPDQKQKRERSSLSRVLEISAAIIVALVLSPLVLAFCGGVYEGITGEGDAEYCAFWDRNSDVPIDEVNAPPGYEWDLARAVDCPRN